MHEVVSEQSDSSASSCTGLSASSLGRKISVNSSEDIFAGVAIVAPLDSSSAAQMGRAPMPRFVVALKEVAVSDNVLGSSFDDDERSLLLLLNGTKNKEIRERF